MFMKWLTEGSCDSKESKEMKKEENKIVAMPRRTTRKIATLSAIVALSLSIAGCSLLPNEMEEEEIPTITPPRLAEKPTYPVKTDTIVIKARGNGKIMSMKEESLFFTLEGISGRIKAVYVGTGDYVEAGQLIAELDVQELQNSLRTESLLFDKKKEEMKRILREADSMPEEEFESAKIDFELARTKLVEIEEKIARAQIRAPFSGSIVSVAVKPGDTTQAYSEVAVLADTSQMTVAVTINKEDLKQIAVGMEVEVDINAAGSHKGKVSRLPVEENQQNRDPWDPWGGGGNRQKDTIDNYLLVELDSFPGEVTRNTPLSASVILNRKENVVVIPPATLRTYGGRTYVQIVENDGTKREVDVEVGAQTPTQVEIVAGLEPGMKVVGR